MGLWGSDDFFFFSVYVVQKLFIHYMKIGF